MSAGKLLRGSSIRLPGRTQLDRPRSQQLPAVQAEQLLRILVGIDEMSGICVEHDDSLGSMIDEQPVASLAFAHCLLRLAPLGDVAQAQDEHFPAR